METTKYRVPTSFTCSVYANCFISYQFCGLRLSGNRRGLTTHFRKFRFVWHAVFSVYLLVCCGVTVKYGDLVQLVHRRSLLPVWQLLRLRGRRGGLIVRLGFCVILSWFSCNKRKYFDACVWLKYHVDGHMRLGL